MMIKESISDVMQPLPVMPFSDILVCDVGPKDSPVVFFLRLSLAGHFVRAFHSNHSAKSTGTPSRTLSAHPSSISSDGSSVTPFYFKMSGYQQDTGLTHPYRFSTQSFPRTTQIDLIWRPLGKTDHSVIQSWLKARVILAQKMNLPHQKYKHPRYL